MTQKKTKLIRYRVATASPNTVFKYGKYRFTFDKQLKAIPVEVDSIFADILLETMDSPCRCHFRKPKHLFEEVKRVAKLQDN